MKIYDFAWIPIFLSFTGVALGEQVTVSLDAQDEDEAVELLQKLNENGAKEDLQFTRSEEGYQFRIALAAESMAKKDLLFGGGADASAAVLTPECKLVFAVSRGGRSTKGGAINALSKEIVKQLKKHLKQ